MISSQKFDLDQDLTNWLVDLYQKELWRFVLIEGLVFGLVCLSLTTSSE